MKGAYDSAPKFQNYKIGQNEELSRQMRMERLYLDKQVRQYIDNLPDDASVDKLPGTMVKPVTEFLDAQRMQYGQIARQLVKSPAGSPRYMQARNQMTKIQSQWKNLSSQLDNFKNLKQEFLKDFDSGLVSNGARTKILKKLFKTDDYNISLSSGSLTYIMDDGEEISAANLPKYFNRNATAVDSLLKLNQQAYKNGLPIDKTSDYLYRRQVRQLITKGGREGVLSLATDEFLDKPLIDVENLNDPNYHLLKEENHEELRDFVIESWMGGISASAEEAYRFKQQKSRPQTGLDYNTVKEIWDSGDLDQLSNMLPVNSKTKIDAYDDGTYEIYPPGRKEPYKLDPSNPRHFGLFLKALGVAGGGGAGIQGIDINRI